MIYQPYSVSLVSIACFPCSYWIVTEWIACHFDWLFGRLNVFGKWFFIVLPYWSYNFLFLLLFLQSWRGEGAPILPRNRLAASVYAKVSTAVDTAAWWSQRSRRFRHWILRRGRHKGIQSKNGSLIWRYSSCFFILSLISPLEHVIKLWSLCGEQWARWSSV